MKDKLFERIERDLFIKFIMNKLNLNAKYPSHFLMAEAIYEDAKSGRNNFDDIVKSLG
jgi:hypothetical protein|tara:strand:+ start:1432 stop:1605 length:174 start_codon:yes stop_codon:yes gene_type:complete